MGQLKCGLISFIVTQCLSASIHGRVNEGSKKKTEAQMGGGSYPKYYNRV